MSKRHIFKTGICVAALMVLGSSTALADMDFYTVTLNTSAIEGLGLGPFSLLFQLVDGTGTGAGNNTITLYNFDFYGGSAVEPPTLFGGASGDLSTSVSITDNTSFDAIFQGFNPGASLSFDINTTNNADPGPFQDQFLMSIIDPNGNGIPTSDAINGSFLTITLDGSASPPVETFASTPASSFSVPAPVVATPEPGAVILLASVVAGLGLRRRRLRQ